MRTLGVALIGILALGAAFREGAPDVTVGVVDLGTVLAKYQKWQDMQKQMQYTRERRGKDLDAMAQEVLELREKLETLDSDSTAYVETQGLLIQKEALLETTSQRYEIETAKSEELQYDRLVDEVTAAAGELAKEMGLGIVLQRALDTPEGTWESVVYVDPRMDLTDRLTERMNKKHAADKK